jgi:hypothetical protein
VDSAQGCDLAPLFLDLRQSEKTFEIQTYLKEYVTDPWFLQLSQDLTIGSLLIHLFCKSFDYQNW